MVGVNLRKQEPLVFEKGAAVVHLAGKAHDLKKTLATSEYFTVNTELTKKVFNAFLASEAGVFVFMSTIKAVEGNDVEASAYSQSKYQAEEYILAQKVPVGKRVYIKARDGAWSWEQREFECVVWGGETFGCLAFGGF